MEYCKHDKEISEKMRIDNYEQFKTLCRMHLSFELDLNTDEFDLPCHEVVYFEKGKLKKWNRLSKKMKSCTAAIKNSPMETNQLFLSTDLINELRNLKDFLMKEENLIQEGIFRRTGSVSRQNELRLLINREKNFNLNENYSVHDCATVYKSFLAELPEPLLTDAHYPAHCQIAELCIGLSKNSPDNKKDQHLLNSVQLLILLLPDENRILLEDIILMLNTTAKYEKSNKMSADTLATLFSPHLICPKNLPPEALHYVSQTMSGVISFMISKGVQIFEIPAKLATDIRAYYHEVKRKKTMSPEQTLDESISDISTVNTVYSFVDREKTAAAHNSNPTDTALAQLYAHIQSLPESSKKRKLIKQFNKENGQGTPLQILMVNRVKNSEPNRSAKSISDSIKKHIFNKGIISRTPKRTTTTGNFSTPNGAPKNHKLRVLFQSPISMISPTNYQQHHSHLSTPTLKSHPLQKSISSSSLLTSSNNQIKPTISVVHSSNISKESDIKCSSSAPVSRVGSSDLTNFINSEDIQTSVTYSQKVLSEATTQHFLDNKQSSLKINNISLEDIENSTEKDAKEPKVFKEQQNLINLKLKFKSEPDLSRLEKICDETTSKVNGLTKNYLKSSTKKLTKGFSMSSLINSFTTPTVTSHKDKKETNLFIDKFSSNSAETCNDESLDSVHSFREVLINKVKKNEVRNDVNNDEIDQGIGSTNNLNVFRNIDLIASTSSQFLGRRSMSPITKSTQRMPKAMQESIMTPRSRKPVMLIATMLSSSDQNQTTYQSDLAKFNEQDEDSFLSNELSLKNSESLYKSKMNENDELYIKEESDFKKDKINSMQDELTSNFREYLLSRSVLTASPVDSSFSSQPDDFGGSTPEIQDINDSQMSSSLLFCLDGNEPENDKTQQKSFSSSLISASTSSNCDNSIVITPALKNRKRPSYQNDIDGVDNYSGENYDYQSLNSKQKKLLVIKDNPGETSL